MMDVSDGLAKDLGRLCEASGVAAAVVLADVPVALSLKELADVLPDVDPLTLAMEGGEDYELLASLPSEAVSSAASRLAERFGTQLTEIGEIREGSGLIAVLPNGHERHHVDHGAEHQGGDRRLGRTGGSGRRPDSGRGHGHRRGCGQDRDAFV